MPLKKVILLLLILIPFRVEAYTKAPVDITKCTLSQLSYYLNEGIITSEQLVNLYLERINECDKNYRAIISINDESVQQAMQLDKERSNGKIRSILHGIPIIVKDNIDVKGMPTTGGTKALKDNYPIENAYAIQQLVDAGTIILAKANMSELAFMASSSRSSYGNVKNAYNTLYSSYGSSGGSAVSVALSFAAAALGTDTNSSVRLPASANNIVGLRPTLGTVSRTGVLPYDPERDTIGTLTKTVEDSIILLNIINGYDLKDKKSINQETQTYKLNHKLNYTIGMPEAFLKGNSKNSLKENKEINKEIFNLMNNAIKRFQMKGVNIVYLDNYYTYTQDNWVKTSYSGYLFCDSFNDYIKNTTGSIRNFNQLAVSNQKITSLNGYISSCNSSASLANKNATKSSYENYILNIMQENSLDAIVYPTTKNELLKSGTSGEFINLSAHAASTIGFPAITVPLGFDSNCLPYGIELMSKKNSENVIYELGNLLETYGKNPQCFPAATSLYEVPSSVSELLTIYDSVKNNPSFAKNNLQKKIQSFFKNYNSYNNVKEEANQLNKQYYTSLILIYILDICFFIFKGLLLIIIIIMSIFLYQSNIRKYLKLLKKS